MADSENTRQHLLALLKKFNTAILVSHTRDGGWHARPMAIAGVEDSGEIYFSTNFASPKVAELEADAEAMATLQSSDRFAAVEGKAEILRDRSVIDRLWSESWRVWFPGGKTDPTLCLIRLSPRHAEYWDRGGLKGFSYAFETARAAAKGETPRIGQDKNAKVDL